MTEAEIRELLELAAKAVGYTTEHPWNAARKRFVDPPLYDLAVCKNGVLVNSGWNPRDYDGDSRRLQVACRINLVVYDNAPPELGLPRSCAVAVANSRDWFAEEFGRAQDELSATRLAVLRAAAAIGRAMP